MKLTAKNFHRDSSVRHDHNDQCVFDAGYVHRTFPRLEMHVAFAKTRAQNIFDAIDYRSGWSQSCVTIGIHIITSCEHESSIKTVSMSRDKQNGRAKKTFQPYNIEAS